VKRQPTYHKGSTIIGDVYVDDFSVIDSHVLIDGRREPVRIGKHVHVGAFASIVGGGGVLEDYSGLSMGARLFCANDRPWQAMTNPTIPSEYRDTWREPITLRKHSLVGANSVVMPGAELGEGCVVGANSFVPMRAKLKPWTTYAGCPVREIGPRDKELVLEMQRKLEEEERKQP